MDYRVKITIRNNRILKAMEEQGYPSVASFCQAHGVDYRNIISIINGKDKPLTKKGELTPHVSDLLDRLHLSVEDAFTEKQLNGFNKNSFQIEMKESQLMALTSPVQNAELLAMENDISKKLKDVISRALTPREERLVRGYYFEKKSMAELAEEVQLSITRADQIIKQSLFKLSKHYGVLDKSGIKEVFPGVGNTPALEIHKDYNSFRSMLRKRKKCDTMTSINS